MPFFFWVCERKNIAVDENREYLRKETFSLQASLDKRLVCLVCVVFLALFFKDQTVA